MSKNDLKEITPGHLRCGTGTCPAVFKLSDGNLVIIGKRASGDIAALLEGRIGADEAAVIISPEYLRAL